MSIYIILYVFIFRISVDNEKVISIGTFGNVKELMWKDIKKVSYILINEQLTLEDGHQKIKVDVKFIGVNEFLDVMKNKVDPSIYSSAYNKFNRQNKLQKK